MSMEGVRVQNTIHGASSGSKPMQQQRVVLAAGKRPPIYDAPRQTTLSTSLSPSPCDRLLRHTMRFAKMNWPRAPRIPSIRPNATASCSCSPCLFLCLYYSVCFCSHPICTKFLRVHECHKAQKQIVCVCVFFFSFSSHSKIKMYSTVY